MLIMKQFLLTSRTLAWMLACVALLAGCQSAAPVHRAKDHRAAGAASLEGGQASQLGSGWATFGADASGGGVNALEHSITTATVSRLRLGWSATLPDLADERPILLPGLPMPDGKTHDVLYLTTDKGTLLALDAARGTQLWASTPPADDNPKYTKASPAADAAHRLVYSYGLDGKVHRFSAITGQEQTGGGWPVRVTRMPQSEKVSSALNFSNGYLYVTTASFSGDAPPYQGHLVVINTKTGATHVFNSLCNDHTHLLALNECTENGGGIWGRPGVVIDPMSGHVFFTTSDGPFTINQGGADWGDSVLELTPDGTKVLDSYTPDNYASESYQNRDLGSTAPLLLPAIPESRTPLLIVQAGKEGLLRLLNRQNLSGQGGPAHVGGELQTVQVPDGCPVLSQPLAWQDPATGALWVIIAALCHMEGYQVVTSAQGVTTLRLAWRAELRATSPILAGGVLFAATSKELLALAPQTGHTLWSSAAPTAGGSIGDIHWESPIVVGGRLFCTDEGSQLSVYALP
jgi:outer membrane protein assembly factor BamB